jgi:hypothetical protein
MHGWALVPTTSVETNEQGQKDKNKDGKVGKHVKEERK